MDGNQPHFAVRRTLECATLSKPFVTVVVKEQEQEQETTSSKAEVVVVVAKILARRTFAEEGRRKTLLRAVSG